MINKLKRRRKIKKLNHHGSKAFTLVETLIVMFIISILLILTNYLIYKPTQELEEHLFVDQTKQMLSRVQLYAIASQNEASIYLKNKKYTFQSNLYGILQFPIPKSLISMYQQKSIIKYDDEGNTTVNKIIFNWPNAKDKFQYQLFYGHYRYEHTKK